mmetsp:Transcript_78316/g.130722  ORF Transcript_78316/g.130722 Transcript_78316/m.130722 type:complete len:99 (-) Transcript_78316:573-869(-)|eukprot:CAMPEP_0174351466 /NCGR_PEP_ID=MMETSP0811_2-20130205/8841_1 /TAXON_ID=73025 ORGANISM="Eutreptiella gymnastica-like, Strain CCMP1594" /NCGR_SAMPLE_ID=MMETSP0811_2 /ASSEMBLY_ACC=CAM_ASM_000667 /LENGTH=98 /DNA_ID=CAMNT_0015480721 /DNA_START=582 /DNA_END=878 /DNA_ORIENTATION=-
MSETSCQNKLTWVSVSSRSINFTNTSSCLLDFLQQKNKGQTGSPQVDRLCQCREAHKNWTNTARKQSLEGWGVGVPGDCAHMHMDAQLQQPSWDLTSD